MGRALATEDGAPRIASCGEALVDFVPAGDTGSWHELLGGSPYNVARGLGRLGVACSFVAAISTDFFGDELVEGLSDCDVGTEHLVRLDRPTTLSFVRLEGDRPSYAFYDAESADRHFATGDPAALAAAFDVVHVGSNSLVLEPAATAFESIAAASGGRRLLSLDPNVRPRLVTDRDAYLSRLERLSAIADVVKLSDEDLAWIEPGSSPEQTAARLLAGGAALVVVTRGSAGAAAFTAAGEASVAAPAVHVVDTIGAGDGFMAGLLAHLAGEGVLHHDAVASMPRSGLEAMLAFAAAVAAAVCTKRGAEMPSRGELGALGLLPVAAG